MNPKLILLIIHLALLNTATLPSVAAPLSLNCGAKDSGNDADNRKWEPDTKYLTSDKKSVASTAETQEPSLSSEVPYMTARIFTGETSYKFTVNSTSRYIIRLHFYPSIYPNYNISNSYSTVTLTNPDSQITLLSNFSAFLTAESLSQSYIIKEYSLSPFNSDEITINFKPTVKSFAFVNGIELISEPEIFDDQIALIGVSDDSSTIDGVSANTENMFRLNVGGQYIPPANDSGEMYRSWYDDTPYMFGAGTITHTTNMTIDYKELPLATAPADVYRTARSQGPNPNINKQKPEFYDVILNGLEVFKISDSKSNLAGKNPVPSELMQKQLLIANREAIDDPNAIKMKHVVGGAVGGVGAIGVAMLVMFMIRKRKRVEGSDSGVTSWLPVYGHSNSKSTTSGRSHGGSSLSTDAVYNCRYFSLVEIKSATNNFDEGNVIGVGGFGKVYKGIIDGNMKVAVKRSNPSSEQGVNEFVTEIEMLSKLRHRHLVSLIGFCEEGNEMVLVYDHMGKGTLREHLYKGNKITLSWRQRLDILIGAAKGLPKEQVSLADYALQSARKGTLEEMVDPQIKGTIKPEAFKKFTDCSLRCLADHGMERPSMGDVLWTLEFVLKLEPSDEESRTDKKSESTGSSGMVEQQEMEQKRIVLAAQDRAEGPLTCKTDLITSQPQQHFVNDLYVD
ncbi:receptor-like protein kinase ANXUR1 [Artemisia annua]|uniref:Receptor-like protein kinase ANXUR1 n=1 Tax=Artemisia annua TaxID=35608 RepID=A0A2U1PBJ8_ARTAN|nr:receptor-like protein kinase ANXUR1 [Artemisia annua]